MGKINTLIGKYVGREKIIYRGNTKNGYKRSLERKSSGEKKILDREKTLEIDQFYYKVSIVLSRRKHSQRKTTLNGKRGGKYAGDDKYSDWEIL